MRGHVKVEKEDGRDAGQDNGKRGGESFQDVVRVLYDHRDYEAAARLQDHYVYDEGIVAAKFKKKVSFLNT